jgi:hypothetical protein
MSSSGGVSTFIREHKTLFIAVLVGLFLLELEIFAMAVAKSGKKASLQVTDAQGNVVYETDEQYPGAFDQKAFEKTFGPLTKYQVRRVSRDLPFPFRAWFVAAIGLPLGVMLMLAFVVRAFVAIFGEEKAPAESPPETTRAEAQSRMDAVLQKIGRLNILTIGFILFLMVIGYWIIPNLIGHLARIGFETFGTYKWYFLGAAGILLGIFIWIIYLRYLLAKKQVENQVVLDKFRLQLEFERGQSSPNLIEFKGAVQGGAQRPAIGSQAHEAERGEAVQAHES